MLESHLLEAVITLNDLGSFHRAAEALNVSQPTLTRYIQKAETICGFTIFERQPRGIHTTPAGRELLEIGQDMRQARSVFDERLERLRTGGGGDLRIGSGPLPARSVVEPILFDLIADHPNLRIEISIDADIAIVNALRKREIDVFVGELTHTPNFEGLSVKVLKRQEMIIVAQPQHRIHTGGPCRLCDLLTYPPALPHLPRYWRHMFEHAAANGIPGSAPIRPVPQFECDDYAVLAGFCERSEFVSGGTRENFEPYLTSGRLREVPLAEPIHWNICAARSESWRFPALDDFWDRLVSNFG